MLSKALVDLTNATIELAGARAARKRTTHAAGVAAKRTLSSEGADGELSAKRACKGSLVGWIARSEVIHCEPIMILPQPDPDTAPAGGVARYCDDTAARRPLDCPGRDSSGSERGALFSWLFCVKFDERLWCAQNL